MRPVSMVSPLKLNLHSFMAASSCAWLLMQKPFIPCLPSIVCFPHNTSIGHRQGCAAVAPDVWPFIRLAKMAAAERDTSLITQFHSRLLVILVHEYLLI